MENMEDKVNMGSHNKMDMGFSQQKIYGILTAKRFMGFSQQKIYGVLTTKD